MSDWLDPLRAALDGATKPITVFVRDDDAGWDDARLLTLLDLFAAHEAPIDLAVIPTELRPGLAAELRSRHAASGGLLGLHQHGYCHANHQPEGRKCEFGPARSFDAQRRDIAEGRRLLHAQLGEALDPIFTPPWNRCTADTGAALADLGVAVLSRDSTAEPLGITGLGELVVQVDWLAARRGERLSRAALGALLAERAAGPAPLGVMLHHAVMNEVERDGVAELLGVLAGHPNTEMCSMARIVRTMNLRKGETS